MTTNYKTAATQGHAPWSKGSESYNTAVGRATKKGAAALIAKANARLPFTGTGVRVIDLGAGTGSVTLLLAQAYPETHILATDISDAMLSILREARSAEVAKSQNASKQDFVSTRVLDIQDACGAGGEAAGTYSHAISTFAVDVILDPQAAIDNMYKLLQPGKEAVAAVGHWDFSRQCDPHGVWEEAAMEVDPSYKPPPRNVSNGWESREHYEEGMRKAGFQNVQGELFKCRFDSGLGVDGFMKFFWESQNPFTIERKASWSGDLQPVKDAMGRIVERRIQSGEGLWVDMGLILGTKP